ncbi:hypothetical protein GA0116948_11758 [Chitinophaga costaii]|uniref:Uncharacterized protein n=1 Tax=Chitinophaga costaii TaxID=1335309 RepID=A0A1C4FVC2_9BACT|nr:TonB-dependent receptor [Chitinophaga costaii]PUZ27243.1 hypothetical protein DCM91_08510 [Chitinophaga costaii]SCC59822.1 hypothetical protein GA0116948_11758 [Chitinophaga costaii]
MNTTQHHLKYMLPAVLALGLANTTHAQQKDSKLKQETIDIISSYQPKLREATKLNLTASLPDRDTTRPRLTYNVPSLNLNFLYQPIHLQPLALGKDSLPPLQNNFIKVGYGNLSSPLVQVGFGSNRNQKFNYGIFGNYQSSKGKDIKYQDYSNLNVGAAGTYLSPLFEIKAGIGFDQNIVHYYGYDHAALPGLGKNDVKQIFNQGSASIGLKNRPNNDWAFSYAPHVQFYFFGDHFKRNESTVILNVPLSQQIFEDIYIRAEGIVDLSTFNEDNRDRINNNLVAIHPAVDIDKPGFVLHAGVNPTWTNSKFYLLPDIVNESHLIRKKLILSSGWISYFDKNSYRNLANRNPFLAGLPNGMLNTRIEEKYTGIKGTLGSHFNYNTKFGAVTWSNLPLFVSDTTTSYKFSTRNESQLKAFELHAEVGYVQEEKFQARASVDWFNYGKQETEAKPWGMVPFQADLFAEYTFVKKLRVHADLFSLSGSNYFVANNNFGKTKSALDLNAGASYDIGKHFQVWITANNIFNTHYQRWYGYQSYGTNVLGGVMFKF